MIYRILTEDKNRAEIVGIVEEHFDSFTIYEAKGYWRGIAENSLVIEIDTLGNAEIDKADNKIEKTITYIAKRIKHVNHQEAVLIQRFDVASQLVK